jgi:hypothetical protein
MAQAPVTWRVHGHHHEAEVTTMDRITLPPMPPAQRRRLALRTLLRSLATAAGLIAVYYLVPLHQLRGVPPALSLGVALLILAGAVALQIRSVVRADFPGIRAIEALALTTPLFILLFAASYFVLAQDDPANFNVPGLTRTDTLYFTVTTFSSVGFGDITAASQTARLVVTWQMLLNLLVLGIGIRLFVGAVTVGRERRSQDSPESSR